MKNRFYLLLTLVMSLSFLSCSSDEEDEPLVPVRAPYSIEMEVGEKHGIVDVGSSVLISMDPYVATVTPYGQISAERVGRTWIQIDGKQIVDVLVYPHYTLYNTPYLYFGTPIIEVRKALGKPNVESANSYVYYENNVVISYYFLEGFLSEVQVSVPAAYYNILVPFLNERYSLAAAYGRGNVIADYVDELNPSVAYMCIRLGITNSYYTVTYYPVVPIKVPVQEQPVVEK